MYVVTGSTGRTGSVVARTLLDAGHRVRVIGRERKRLQQFADAGAEAFVADPTDPAAMRDAFNGASAAWVMLQPNYIPDCADFRAFQSAIIGGVVPALEHARVPKVVSLSSWGADRKSGTGPVLGLHDLEQALNAISGVDVLHLRAGYYMENLLSFVDAVAEGKNPSGPFRADIRMPLIATVDVGTAGAYELLKGAFKGKSTRELQGSGDLSMREAVSIIGRAADLPSLRYEEMPIENTQHEWRQAGLSPNVISLMTEVVTAINNGIIATREHRSANTTTPTTFQQFVTTYFMPLYQSKRPSAHHT